MLIKTPQFLKKTPEKCINYDDTMKIVCKNKQILEALLKEIIVSKNINGQVNKYEYDLNQLKQEIKKKYDEMNNTHNTINLKTENLADIYAGLSKEVKKNKYIKIETEIKNKMKLMKDNKEYILTIIKFIFSINDNNDEFLNKVEKLLDRYIHNRETELIYSYMPNKKKQGKSKRMEELEFFNKEFDNYLKTIGERITEIQKIDTKKLLEQYQKQQENEQQEQQQIALVQEQQQKEKKEQQKETLKEYFLDMSSKFKNSKGKKIQRIHFIGRIDDNNNNTVETVVEGLPKYKINATMLSLLKETFTEKEELIKFFTELKKEALTDYFYNKSEIQKNYNGKHLNKRIHILTKKKINNVNKNIKNNTKVKNTVNSLFKQGHKSYIQPEMLTLLKNTFTSKRELLNFLRELKQTQNNKNNENPYKVMSTKVKKDLIEYFRDNRIDRINKEWLKIIKEDRHSYTVNQAIHLIFCNFTKNPPCKINKDKQNKLEEYANDNINTLLKFIDEVLNLGNVNVYENMSNLIPVKLNKNRDDLRKYFLEDFSEYENNKNITKINMDFFNKIKQFVKSNDENTTTSQGPYEIGHYVTINTNNNSNKSTFDKIVETLFSCDIKKNNKTTMKCKIEIDMIKNLKEYTKNIKTLVEFLSELLKEAGINTNEYASLNETRAPENPYTSYMSEIKNPTYQNYPPIPSRSSNPFVNNDYSHLSTFQKRNNKTNEYSQLNRSNIYT